MTKRPYDDKKNKQSVTDKEIKGAMTKWNKKASESTKQKSFSKAMEGIEFSREKTVKRRKSAYRKNWLKGTIATTTAVILLALMLISTDVVQNALLSSGDNPAPLEDDKKGSTEDEKEPDESEELEESDELQDIPEVNRPASKDVVTNPEGMGEVINAYQLLHEDNLPFTTYIPDDFGIKKIDEDLGSGVSVSPVESDVMMMKVVLFDQGVSEEKALDYVKKAIDGLGEVEELPREEYEDIPEWALASFYHSGEMFGTMTLGKYNDQLFYVHDQYIGDAGDGWGPIKYVIFDEWRWTETAQPLNEPEGDSGA
ncbi:hypothetical protein [Aquibacillus saliphilus]|uniref:hypothetical protein n=1 Tax=Aquibacillus saliphilus TaxID=1909422 RepID=UPI001CF01A92|nr:hypothetical protein [Aquibacillus saliphilus]